MKIVKLIIENFRMFNKKAIFVNTVSQVIVRVATLAFALVSIKLLTNYLGTTGVGEFNTITTYINFFVVLADLGLFAVGVREIAKNPKKEKEIISNIFVIRLISAILACIIAIIIVYSTDYSSHIKLGVLIGTGYLFFNLISSVYDIILQYRLKMQFSAIAEFISKLISIIVLYIVIINDAGFFWSIFTIALSGITIFLLKAVFASKYVKISTRYNAQIAKGLLSMSWPLGIVFIVNNMYFKIDSILLFVIKGAASVGIYTVAYKVLEVTAFVGAYFASALKPTLSKNIESNPDAVGNVVGKSILIMLSISLPITICCIVFPKEIINLLSNSSFESGSGALVLLSLTLPLIYIDTLLGEVLLAKDRRKLLIKIAIFILSFNIVLNLILIPIYSFFGAAFVTVLSEFILLLINYYYVKKEIIFKLDYLKMTKIMLVALITLTISFISKTTGLNFIILMLFSILVYGICFYGFNIIDLKNIRSMMASK